MHLISELVVSFVVKRRKGQMAVSREESISLLLEHYIIQVYIPDNFVREMRFQIHLFVKPIRHVGHHMITNLIAVVEGEFTCEEKVVATFDKPVKIVGGEFCRPLWIIMYIRVDVVLTDIHRLHWNGNIVILTKFLVTWSIGRCHNFRCSQKRQFHQNDDIPVFVNHFFYKYNVQCITPHYNDVIMTTMASQITSLTVVYSTIYSDADQRKYQKLRVTGLCVGNSPGPVNSPQKRASYGENVSIWWRHHDLSISESDIL